MGVSQGSADSEQVLARIQAELPLVERVVARLIRSIGNVGERDDLLSAGREGLLDAARRFDESLGVPFQAYAHLRIRGAVIDWVRCQSPLHKKAQDYANASDAMHGVSDTGSGESAVERSASEGGVSEEQYARNLASRATAAALAMTVGPSSQPWDSSSVDVENPEELVSQAQLIELIHRGIDSLNFVEADVVRARYFEGKSFSEVATALNMSRSWACRLHAQAMERLTRALKQSL